MKREQKTFCSSHFNAMSRTPLLPLHICTLLVIFCSSSISCFSNKCASVNRCGNFSFSYPFGQKHRSCGDRYFQIDCHPGVHRPFINISGIEFQILEPYILGNNRTHQRIRLAINNFCGGGGKLFGNYTQSWWYRPKLFQMDQGYAVVAFWTGCQQIKPFEKNYTLKTVELCGEIWYYSFNGETEINRTFLCKNNLHIPVKKEVVQFNQSISNQTLINQGFWITWRVDPYRDQNCQACLWSKGFCGFNGSTEFLCYCPDGTSQPDKCHGQGHVDANKSAIITGCSIGGALLTAVAVLLLFIIFYVKKRETLIRDFTSGFSKQKRKDMEESGLSGLKMGNFPIFSYQELCQATNCFHKENEVGNGGFGLVYFGKLGDGRSVAVKRLYDDNARRVEQFINEVMTFSSLNHPRLVRLYGCAYEDTPELLLVYEFVSNGTLAAHLHGHRRGHRGLPWDTRLNIAIQTAEALAFLHNLDPPLFHRDVKSSNILLDEDFNVKIADFGLCRIMPGDATHVTTAPQGTPGYVDPQYHQCYQLTEKSDVYSFGVVLTEIISGKMAVDVNRKKGEINLANMAVTKIQEGALHELVDEQQEIEMNPKLKVVVTAVAELAFRCLVTERDDRPVMKEVVAELEQIEQSWLTSTTPAEPSGSLSDIKQATTKPVSPISVQYKWPSISSTPNNSG